MSLRFAYLLLLILLAGVCSASDEQPLPQANTGQYLAFGQIRSARMMVDYCNSAAPELTASLESAYSSLRARAIIAIEPSLKRIPKSEALSAPVPRYLMHAFDEVAAEAIKAVHQMPPTESCRSILISINGRTLGELKARSEEAMNNYERLYATSKKAQH